MGRSTTPALRPRSTSASPRSPRIARTSLTRCVTRRRIKSVLGLTRWTRRLISLIARLRRRRVRRRGLCRVGLEGSKLGFAYLLCLKYFGLAVMRSSGVLRSDWFRPAMTLRFGRWEWCTLLRTLMDNYFVSCSSKPAIMNFMIICISDLTKNELV